MWPGALGMNRPMASVNAGLPTVLRLCYLQKRAVGQIPPRAGLH